MGKENFSAAKNNIESFLEKGKVEEIAASLREIFFGRYKEGGINLKIFYRDYDKAGKNIKIAEGNFEFDEDKKILYNADNGEKIDLKSIEKIISSKEEDKNFYE